MCAVVVTRYGSYTVLYVTISNWRASWAGVNVLFV